MSEEDNIVILTDDEGNDVSFEFLDLVHYQNKDYVVLLPTEQEEGEEEGVLILEVEKSEEDGGELFNEVEDETVLEAVFALFQEQYDGDYEFDAE